jgi:hypothetical protein
MKRFATWTVLASWLVVFGAVGCGGRDIEDPPKDYRVEKVEGKKGRKTGIAQDEPVKLPPMPATAGR